ncbi:Precursor of CEP3 [Glycine soja]
MPPLWVEQANTNGNQAFCNLVGKLTLSEFLTEIHCPQKREMPNSCHELLGWHYILGQGFHSIEGRYLKSGETIKHQMHSGISTTNVADVSPPTPPSAAVPGRDVDNFRPTAPGHSPGVGHTVHN